MVTWMMTVMTHLNGIAGVSAIHVALTAMARDMFSNVWCGGTATLPLMMAW